MNRDLIAAFAREYPDDYPEVEVLARLRRHGRRVEEVPVAMHARAGGASSINLARATYYMIKVFLAVLKNLARGAV
ncbi:MAG: hypothetical protein AB1776_08165 [Bacillota bacterium]